MAQIKLRVRERWWVRPYMWAATTAAKAAILLGIVRAEDLDAWIDREAQFIVDHGIILEEDD